MHERTEKHDRSSSGIQKLRRRIRHISENRSVFKHLQLEPQKAELELLKWTQSVQRPYVTSSEFARAHAAILRREQHAVCKSWHEAADLLQSTGHLLRSPPAEAGESSRLVLVSSTRLRASEEYLDSINQAIALEMSCRCVLH